jgi:hypothetical protein
MLQMGVNGGGFFSSIGEDGKIEPYFRFGFTGQEEQGGTLDSGTEVEDVEFFHALCRERAAEFPARSAGIRRRR